MQKTCFLFVCFLSQGYVNFNKPKFATFLTIVTSVALLCSLLGQTGRMGDPRLAITPKGNHRCVDSRGLNFNEHPKTKWPELLIQIFNVAVHLQIIYSMATRTLLYGGTPKTPGGWCSTFGS